jgi:hypothetical protein
MIHYRYVDESVALGLKWKQKMIRERPDEEEERRR